MSPIENNPHRHHAEGATVSLIVSVFELGMIAWSHQSSHCTHTTPEFAPNDTQPSQPLEIRAFGYSRLYGVTPLGDELDLTLNWCVRGMQGPDVFTNYVYAELVVDAGTYGPVSLDQTVVLIDADGVPMPSHTRAQALLASIRHCNWCFPARQCLTRHLMTPTLGQTRVPRARGRSTVSA